MNTNDLIENMVEEDNLLIEDSGIELTQGALNTEEDFIDEFCPKLKHFKDKNKDKIKKVRKQDLRDYDNTYTKKK